MRIRLLPLLLFAAVVFAHSLAQATIVMPSSLERMAAFSDAIVVGRIGGQSAYEAGGKIYTGVTVEVEEYLKFSDPAKPSTIELKILGGKVGDRRMEFDQSPSFKDGEEVLLFLKASGDKYVVYGFYYGAQRIVPSPDGLSRQVRGPLFQTGKVYNFKTREMVINGMPLGGEELGRFKARIDRALTNPGGGE